MTTPYIKEEAKLNCARKPEFEGQPAVECPWCKHGFTLPEAQEVMFSNGKLIHCPWCELPLNWKCLGPPTNLQGQLSKGHKTVAPKVPSLTVGENELTNLQDYDARKLCDVITKLHPHGLRLLKK